MAVVFDAVSSDRADEPDSSLTISHTVTTSGSDRYLRCGIHMKAGADTPSVDSVAYGGNSLTKLDEILDFGSSGNEVEYWYLLAPPTGANNLVISLTGALGSGENVWGNVASYTGVDQNNPHGTVAKDDGDGGGSSSVDVTSQQGEMVVDIFAENSLSSESAGPGQTERGSQDGLFASDEGGAGTVTMSWTHSGGSAWGLIALPLRQASGGRARLIQYLHNAFASSEMGRTVILDSESGDEVNVAQLDADNWMRTDGPFLPTTFRYADLVEDPAVSYLESVSSAGRIEAAQESALESLFRRLGGRSV